MSAIPEIISSSQDALPVCLGGENPNRLVMSLLEMIKYFDLSRFGLLMADLESCQTSLTQLIKTSPAHPAVGLESFIEPITKAFEYCKLHGFDNTTNVATIALSILKSDRTLNVSTLRAEIRHVQHSLMVETNHRLYADIPSGKGKYLGEGFGEDVHKAFPSARFDITEAGACLAVGLNTAAGFHLMRAAEVGLWELGKDRQIPLAVSSKIEFSEWGLIIRELETAVQAITQWPNKPSKENAHKFYNAALVEIRAFNDGWRRHLAHVRKFQLPLHDDETVALYGHVERFMKTLAANISEGKYTPLEWS